MKEKKLYLPGLNGLRTIAALAVVFSHSTLAMPQFNLVFAPFGTTSDGKSQGYLLGSYGVSIFFVLSGFLISYLLLLEKELGKIDIKKFYIRRILRIWPLYYLFLALCIITLFAVGRAVDLRALFYYVFFAANIPFIYKFAIPFLSHYWSLAVEEQFYLFWPWIMMKIKKHLFAIILILVILQNIIRVILWYFVPHSGIAIFSLVNRFDCMMIGGLGAILFESKNKYFLKIVDNKIMQVFAFFGLLVLVFNKLHINAIVDNFVVSMIALILIIGQINVKNRIVNLDIPICNFLGKISFGIYVYHPLIIFILALFLKDMILLDTYKIILIYLLVVSVTLLVAYMSYEYFEKPFVKYKDKFAVIKSSPFRIK